MNAKLALTAIIGSFVPFFALAQSDVLQDRIAKMDRHFAYTDKDSDGFIAREEALPYPALVKHFVVIDYDNDGRLSREEMQAYRMGTHNKPRTANSSVKKAIDSANSSALTKADADDNTRHRKNF